MNLRQEQWISPPLAGGVRGGGVKLGNCLQNEHRTQSFAPLPNPPREGEGIRLLPLRLGFLTFSN